MYKKLYICLLSFFLLVIGNVSSQKLNIEHKFGNTSIGFDLNSVYNYNIYEHNRFGAGIELITPLKYDNRYGSLFQNYFMADAYVGYGVRDKAWKYGGSLGLSFPRSLFRSIAIGYCHDLTQIGKHSFIEYDMLNTSDNSSYFSSRFSGVDHFGVTLLIDPPGPSRIILDYSHSRERYLFDAHNLLYPAIYGDDNMPYYTFNEVGIRLFWGDHWKFSLLTNIIASQDNSWHLDNNPLFGLQYYRFLSEYSNKINFNGNRGQLSLFAQCGIILNEAPISRMFDLSGTGGSYYYFNNSFLTVRPNTFMSDAFALASIRYTLGISLWKTASSEPHPFVQLNAMWGMLQGKNISNSSGTYILEDTQPQKLIVLTTPDHGLLEPCIGFDKLIRWGVVDVGVAAAYQITPKNSPYHIDNFWNKFAVICIAKLIL